MDAYLGEIRLMSFGFPPRAWAICDGRLLSINSNAALYALLGTTYGGNGVTTFGLPDLRGRVANSVGQRPGGPTNYFQGTVTGSERVALAVNALPVHTHDVAANTGAANTGTAGSQPSTGASLAQAYVPASTGSVPVNRYATSANTTMAANALDAAGGSQPHNNMQPFLVLNYCICTNGIFPSRQ